jgi:hypothetical protein
VVGGRPAGVHRNGDNNRTESARRRFVMRVMQLVGELHHVLRAAALVFPARRRCRELEAEVAELRRFVVLARGSAQAVADGVESLANAR